MVEVTGLQALVADLTAAPGRAQRRSMVAVRVSGDKVARTARDLISGLAHAPAYPASIDSEVKIVGAGIEAQVGPDKAKAQGALGNLLEYGSVNNAPLAHLGPALDIEGPSFMRAMSDVGDPW